MQRQDSLQELTYICHREGRQDIDLELLGQLRVTGIGLRPLVLGLGDEPACQDGEGQIVLPRLVFLSLELIPAEFRFAILVGPLDKVAHTLQPGEVLARRVGAGVAQGIGVTLAALVADLNVFLFSSNVSIKEELELKQFAARKQLLVMGPDCGTSLIGGVGIGFANVVRKGPIGVVGATGTGLQEFTSQVHNAGLGISHAIGTGSHDLSDEIGGITTFTALNALEADPQTKVIAVISKPPGAKTLDRLIKRLQRCTKPTIGCFLGTRVEPSAAHPNLQCVRTIDEAVLLAIKIAQGDATLLQIPFTPEEAKWIARERAGWSSDQKYLRGLFAGGTFCYQSQQIFQDGHITIWSGDPLDPKYRLANPDRSREHTLVDMGDDYYTLGKPHPMIDGTLRRRRILAESRDPQVAVLLLDFILGYNASTDPVGELLDAILEAKQVTRQRRGSLTVVASICGTDGDPQDLNLQAKMLKEAGVIVFHSNAKAAQFCCELLEQS